MSLGLRTGLLLASISVMAAIIFFVVTKKLNIKYSVVWMLWALLSLFMAVFPGTFYEFAHIVGIELPVNAVFLIMIALLYALVFYVYCMISKHNEEIIRLTYKIADLEKEIEELKNKNER